MFSYIRDDVRVLTRFKDGDRYVYSYPSDAEIPLKQSICWISACYFIAKQPENTFKSCKVELQHSSKENEEGTSLPHETLDIAQLPNPYSV